MNRPTVSCTCNGTCHPEPSVPVNENHAVCECGHMRCDHRTVAAPLRAAKFGVCMHLNADRRVCGCSEFEEKT
jgi:hypothetical protein